MLQKRGTAAIVLFSSCAVAVNADYKVSTIAAKPTSTTDAPLRLFANSRSRPRFVWPAPSSTVGNSNSQAAASIPQHGQRTATATRMSEALATIADAAGDAVMLVPRTPIHTANLQRRSVTPCTESFMTVGALKKRQDDEDNPDDMRTCVQSFMKTSQLCTCGGTSLGPNFLATFACTLTPVTVESYETAPPDPIATTTQPPATTTTSADPNNATGKICNLHLQEWVSEDKNSPIGVEWQITEPDNVKLFMMDGIEHGKREKCYYDEPCIVNNLAGVRVPANITVTFHKDADYQAPEYPVHVEVQRSIEDRVLQEVRSGPRGVVAARNSSYVDVDDVVARDAGKLSRRDLALRLRTGLGTAPRRKVRRDDPTMDWDVGVVSVNVAGLEWSNVNQEKDKDDHGGAWCASGGWDETGDDTTICSMQNHNRKLEFYWPC